MHELADVWILRQPAQVPAFMIRRSPSPTSSSSEGVGLLASMSGRSDPGALAVSRRCSCSGCLILSACSGLCCVFWLGVSLSLACTAPPALAAGLWPPVAFFRFPAQSEPHGAVLSRCRSVKTSPEDAFGFARSSAGVMPETVQQRILWISAACSTLDPLRPSRGPVLGDLLLLPDTERGRRPSPVLQEPS